MDSSLAGYRIYRSTLGAGGPFSSLSANLLSAAGYCDLNVSNGQTNYYLLTAVDTNMVESSPAAAVVAAAPAPFANDNAFLDYVQEASFDYFWYLSNPTNGLTPDRTATNSVCSIAAVGFGLTAIGIGVDHGWISRADAVARTATTLNTFAQGAQGSALTGIMGYKGW